MCMKEIWYELDALEREKLEREALAAPPVPTERTAGVVGAAPEAPAVVADAPEAPAPVAV